MDYPEWTKAQLLLLFFWNRLQQAYDFGDSQLRLAVVRSGPYVGVHVVSLPTANVSDEIPELSRGGEAVAVFDRLRREELIHVGFGRQNPDNSETQPFLYGISTPGLIDIGKVPDPQARLAHAFAAASRAIQQDESIPEPQKPGALDAATKMSTLVNNSQMVTQAISQALAGG